MNEHAVLQLLVVVGDLQHTLTSRLNNITSGMSASDKRDVVEAMESVRTGVDETEHRLRVMLMTKWGKNADRVEHMATRTSQLEPSDVIPVPWAKYRPSSPAAAGHPSGRPPTIMELVPGHDDRP